MLRFGRSSLCILCAALVSGCGLIINGTSQNVPVKLPAGTIVEQETEEGKLIEIERHAEKDGTIKLDRNRAYRLRLIYKGEELETKLYPRFNGAGMQLDLFFPLLLVPDVITGALNSFNGIEVHFSGDSLDPKRKTSAYIEPYDPDHFLPEAKQFFLVGAVGERLQTGMIISFFPTNFALGAGYDLSSNLALIASVHFGTANDLLPLQFSNAPNTLRYTLYGAEMRYKFFSDFYGSSGFGVARVFGDLEQQTTTSGPIFFQQITIVGQQFSGTLRTIPATFAAIGYAGKTGYVELRYSSGLQLPIFTKENIIQFHVLSFDFGFILHL